MQEMNEREIEALRREIGQPLMEAEQVALEGEVTLYLPWLLVHKAITFWLNSEVLQDDVIVTCVTPRGNGLEVDMEVVIA